MGLDDTAVTPHLGASTTEAQERAATTVARSALLTLSGSPAPEAADITELPNVVAAKRGLPAFHDQLT
ncbi:hypothetical protein [Streptomyces sp. NPDC052496]|uniref:hypothetical protein n=1 Tax=Streptomyces sp. NPDC052496 TaxID=3154951 RepID=UPI003414A243